MNCNKFIKVHFVTVKDALKIVVVYQANEIYSDCIHDSPENMTQNVKKNLCKQFPFRKKMEDENFSNYQYEKRNIFVEYSVFYKVR